MLGSKAFFFDKTVSFLFFFNQENILNISRCILCTQFLGVLRTSSTNFHRITAYDRYSFGKGGNYIIVNVSMGMSVSVRMILSMEVRACV